MLSPATNTASGVVSDSGTRRLRSMRVLFYFRETVAGKPWSLFQPNKNLKLYITRTMNTITILRLGR